MSKPKTKVMPPLSFMKDVPDGKRKTRRVFWSVESTGEYAADNELGRSYADELLACIRKDGHSFLLNSVLKHMVEAGRFGGIEVGFIARIGEYAALGCRLTALAARKEGAE